MKSLLINLFGVKAAKIICGCISAYFFAMTIYYTVAIRGAEGDDLHRYGYLLVDTEIAAIGFAMGSAHFHTRDKPKKS